MPIVGLFHRAKHANKIYSTVYQAGVEYIIPFLLPLLVTIQTCPHSPHSAMSAPLPTKPSPLNIETLPTGHSGTIHLIFDDNFFLLPAFGPISYAVSDCGAAR